MKKTSSLTLILLVTVAICSGCASIVDGYPNKKVRLNSEPAGAKVTIYNKSGTEVASATTPAEVSLKKYRGAYAGERYRLVFEAPGYYPSETHISSTVNGWYFGNVLFGGAVGLLLV